jgi:hypothetical protein
VKSNTEAACSSFNDVVGLAANASQGANRVSDRRPPLGLRQSEHATKKTALPLGHAGMRRIKIVACLGSGVRTLRTDQLRASL